jgi:hypothetical protein
LKWMVLMKENQSDCHRFELQQFRVLRNYGTRPSLNRPTMPAKVRERGQYSAYTGHAIGVELRRSTWTHNWSQLGFTLPSQTFMHGAGFTI